MTKQIFAVLIALSGLNCGHSVASTVAFDGITLGTTTCRQYRTEHPGYPFSVENNLLVIDGRHFNIPAKKIEIFCAGLDKPVEAVMVKFSSEQAAEAYRVFPAALNKKYGKPVLKNIPFVGDRQIMWETKDAQIEYFQEHMALMAGYVGYMTKDFLNRAEKHELDEENKRQSAADALM